MATKRPDKPSWDMSRGNWVDADFPGLKNLPGFSGSYLKGCDLTGADLTGADFKKSSLLKTTLTKAVLNRTSFHETDLSGIVFSGVVQDCSFDNCSFSKVIFQDAKLVNTFFKGKSLKHIRFVDCEADRLTYEFLKNGKAELTGITLITP